MSAVKLIFKRSSILGKRPTSANLEPGEIGLNTNAVDPGLFFEVSDGAIVKAGPTAVLPVQPTSFPSKGELWYNTESGELNVGTVADSIKTWKTVAAPFLEGSPNVVFVAPEFPGSTDSVLNNGQTLPYQTITRAVLELSKIRIQRALAGATEAGESNRYTIYYAPSRVTANNGQGNSVANFDVDFSDQGTANPTIGELQQFNSEDGGIIIPAGISIVAMDLKKCEVKPTYIPTYQNPSLAPSAAGVNQPLSCIFKISGNSYFNNFSISDKVQTRDIIDVTPFSSENPSAVFHSSRPHGLAFNDKVTIALSANVEQTSKFASGEYYVNPIDTFTFLITTQDQSDPNAPSAFVLYDVVPGKGVSGVRFVVTNELYSAHRLSAFCNVSKTELNDYYTKVQLAFPNYFADTVTQGSLITSDGEVIIVGPTDERRPDTTSSNTVKNSSAYLNQVNIRSQYGMNGGDFDGSEVGGFRSVIANACTVVSLQTDPAAYEVYTTVIGADSTVGVQKWWTLTDATYYSLPLGTRPVAKFLLSRQAQITYLNTIPIENVRYYYKTQTTSTSETIGTTDIQNDFRHYGFRFRERAYGQLQSVYTIGCAVGVWALNGGQIALTNSTSNFGSISFLSEAFYGIGTTYGAENNQKGFLLEGFQRPLSLLFSQVTDDANKEILSLGSRIISVTTDPSDATIQRINLDARFSPCYLLPYSLPAGSAIWVAHNGNTYRAFLATDGGPTIVTTRAEDDNTTIVPYLRIRSSDSNLPAGETTLVGGVPYIRRFRDPRNENESSYSMVFTNSSPIAVSPEIASVLRLNQSSNAVNVNSIRPNVQFDPGESGGWGRTFSVQKCTPAIVAESPQFNYAIADPVQSERYHIIISNTDASRPWYQLNNNATGQLVTYQDKNWYAAENNYWYNVYYDVTFEGDTGPLKIPPTEACTSFVPAATLIRQEPVSTTFQGTYGSDPDTAFYPEDAQYMRGYTVPQTAARPECINNGDDGTDSMSLCIFDVVGPNTTQTTTLVDTNSQIQFQRLPGGTLRYRPAILQFSVASVANITDPTQGMSILRFFEARTDQEGGDKTEYFRVIDIEGTEITAIRLNSVNSYYPDPTDEDPLDWPSGTTVQIMEINQTPVPAAYDPIWANSKRSLLRFMEIMGYVEEDLLPALTPRYWGERFLAIGDISAAPDVNGYARSTSQWPFEFNQPSSIVSNTHTWAYAGYYNYSVGLPKFQNAALPHKITADFQCYTLWGGKLAVSGVNEVGEFFQFGPQLEATTSRFYRNPGGDGLNLIANQIP